MCDSVFSVKFDKDTFIKAMQANNGINVNLSPTNPFHRSPLWESHVFDKLGNSSIDCYHAKLPFEKYIFVSFEDKEHADRIIKKYELQESIRN